jgi:hypothetical protein
VRAMELSQKKRTELYKAFSEPIIKLRIQMSRMGPGDKKLKEMDDKLFRLEQEIWREIAKALDIKNP